MTEKPDANQLKQVAYIGLDAGKDDFHQMIEHIHNAIAAEFAKRGITIADKGGMTSEFTLVMETILAWLWAKQFEVRLKDEFRLIRVHRGYP